MDSNNAYPPISASKPNMTQVYHDSFHQALSLRPSAVGGSREMDERDLFLMSQMHAPWARQHFAEGTHGSADQPSTSGDMYGCGSHNVFPSNMPSNACLSMPMQPADLPMPVHHHQQQRQLQLQHLQLQQPPQEQPCLSKAVGPLTGQIALQSVEGPALPLTSEPKQPKAKKRKSVPNQEHTEPKPRRPANPEEWKKKKKKAMRDKGEQYVTVAGKLQEARQVQPIDCSKCRFRCSEKIPEEAREDIHKLYWSLASYERQRAFIAQHVEQNDIKQVKTQKKPRREVAHSFFFVHKRKEHRVCKSFFTKTLDITNKLVDYTMKKTECGVYTGRDERGRRDPVNKTKPEDADFIRWHIGSFPTVDGGRSKKDKNKKRFLSQDLNVGKMYSMYKDTCEQTGKKPVGISVYRKAFKREFNLSFAKPKKEHCANCKCGEGGKKKGKEGCSVKNAPSVSIPEQPGFFPQI
ncbi:uncharacterized protein [Littorina saxatilis]|uniref:uncharacterized protein n=1 Tax=Littorina saxatilis TaxID=31220 RepID=UPI0038B5D487